MSEFGPKLERIERRRKEVARIRKELERFLAPLEAQYLAANIGRIAWRVDGEIDRILQDPLVPEFFDYDGLFFTPKGTHQFHRAFDGIHILRCLDDARMDVFFRGRRPTDAIRWLLEDLDTHVWEAAVRRMNWEDEGHLGVLSREVVEAVMEDVEERRRIAAAAAPRPLSSQEQVFFRSYENEIRELRAKNPTANSGSQTSPASNGTPLPVSEQGHCHSGQ